jgi:hypothetical protein
MSTEYPILSRSQLGMNERVVSFNRVTSRPLLPDRRTLVVIHWPGARTKYVNSDLGQVIRGVERWKPGLYNWFIHPNGTIGTQAGRYQSAATKGHNAESYSVNILVGMEEQITQHQVWSFRYLVGAMAWSQAISLTPMIAPHGWILPTQCPGPSVLSRFNELTDGLRWA